MMYVNTRPSSSAIDPTIANLFAQPAEAKKETLPLDKVIERTAPLQRTSLGIHNFREKATAYKEAVKKAETDGKFHVLTDVHSGKTGFDLINKASEGAQEYLVPEEVKNARREIIGSIENELIPLKLMQEGIPTTNENLQHARDTYNLRNMSLESLEALADSIDKANKMQNRQLSTYAGIQDIGNLYEDKEQYEREGGELEREFRAHAGQMGEEAQQRYMQEAPIRGSMNTPQESETTLNRFGSGLTTALQGAKNEDGELSKKRLGENVISATIRKGINDVTAQDIIDFFSMFTLFGPNNAYHQAANSPTVQKWFGEEVIRDQIAGAVVSVLPAPLNRIAGGLYAGLNAAAEGIHSYREQTRDGGEPDWTQIAKDSATRLTTAALGGASGAAPTAAIKGFRKLNQLTQPLSTARNIGTRARRTSDTTGAVKRNVREETDALYGEKGEYGQLTEDQIINKLNDTLSDTTANKDLSNRIELTLRNNRKKDGSTFNTPSEAVSISLRDLRKTKQAEKLAEVWNMGVQETKDLIRNAENVLFPNAEKLTDQAGIISKIEGGSEFNPRSISEEINEAGFTTAQKVQLFPQVLRRIMSPDEWKFVESALSKEVSFKSWGEIPESVLNLARKFSPFKAPRVKQIIKDIEELRKELKISKEDFTAAFKKK